MNEHSEEKNGDKERRENERAKRKVETGGFKKMIL
jgi:hypothetical protein